MFVDPVPDGLWRTVEVLGNLGDGKVLAEHLIDGATLNVDSIARVLFRHG